MRRDDILLNELYSKINNQDLLNEGIIDTAKEKLSGMWRNPFKASSETDKISELFNELKYILMKNGYDPKEFLNYDKIRGLSKQGTEQEVTPEPPNWGGPSNYMDAPKQEIPNNEPSSEEDVYSEPTSNVDSEQAPVRSKPNQKYKVSSLTPHPKKEETPAQRLMRKSMANKKAKMAGKKIPYPEILPKKSNAPAPSKKAEPKKVTKKPVKKK
jgi:hypothetical protein